MTSQLVSFTSYGAACFSLGSSGKVEYMQRIDVLGYEARLWRDPSGVFPDVCYMRVPDDVCDLSGLHAFYTVVLRVVVGGVRVIVRLGKSFEYDEKGPYSYLNMIRPVCRYAVAKTFGPNPPISMIGNLPGYMFMPVEVLQQLWMAARSSGLADVTDERTSQSAWSAINMSRFKIIDRTKGGPGYALVGRDPALAANVFRSTCGRTCAAVRNDDDYAAVAAAHRRKDVSCVAYWFADGVGLRLLAFSRCLRDVTRNPAFLAACGVSGNLSEFGRKVISLYSSVPGVVHLMDGAMSGEGLAYVWTGMVADLSEAGDALLDATTYCNDSGCDDIGYDLPLQTCRECPDCAAMVLRSGALDLGMSEDMPSWDFGMWACVGALVFQRDAADCAKVGVNLPALAAEYCKSLDAVPPDIYLVAEGRFTSWFEYAYANGEFRHGLILYCCGTVIDPHVPVHLGHRANVSDEECLCTMFCEAWLGCTNPYAGTARGVAKRYETAEGENGSLSFVLVEPG